MPKSVTWEESVQTLTGNIADAFERFLAPHKKFAAEFICVVHGHEERMMNPVVRRGTTDAAGGSDLIKYTPYYCTRCGDRWRENANGDVIS